MASDKSLSVIIPARNEMFLARTVQDLIENIRGEDTDIIVVCDGNWPDPPMADHPKVTLIHHSESIGQRAACNEAVRYSRAKYIAKCDAHCSFDEGFDVKLMEKMQDNWTVAPIMKNLHCFDYVCENNHRRYQGPAGPCQECGKPTKVDIIWKAKNNPQSTAYCIDPSPHFQYHGERKKHPEYQRTLKETGLTETMSLQGSFFMLTRQKYFELGINDESWGSWGTQGAEVAIKTWTSGGKVMVVHSTWQSHMFRTKAGEKWGFPYQISGRQVEKAKKTARKLFFESKWGSPQIYPLSWLVRRFWPLQYWTDDDLKRLETSESLIGDRKGHPLPAIGLPCLPRDGSLNEATALSGDSLVFPKPIPSADETESVKGASRELLRFGGQQTPPDAESVRLPSRGIVYYSDCQLSPDILEPCQKQLLRSNNGYPIISITLKPMDFGQNYTLPLERSVLTMFKQILEGIKRSTAEILFFCEHDCLYTKEHFQFTPPKKDVFYYNEAQWQVDAVSGRALFYHCMRLSTLCAYRELLLEHYTKRVERVEKEGFTLKMGYEPGGHRYPRGVDNYTRDRFMTPYPLIDLRHSGTVSPNRWRKKDFRNQAPLWAWTESDSVPGWGQTRGRMKEFLESIR